MSLPIIIRPMNDSDRDFVITSWVRTFSRSFFAKKIDRWTQPYARFLEPDRESPSGYYYLHRLYANSLVDSPGVATVVAAYEGEDGDSDLVLGFACGDYNRKTIHYVCVKPAYHRMGIATSLLRALKAFNQESGWVTDPVCNSLKEQYHALFE